MIRLAAALLLLVTIGTPPVRGMDHGFDPADPRTKWMETKRQPDNGQSCCGKGDGYLVDRYRMNPDGSATVWIDDSGDMTFPDGTKRPRIVDTEITVPKTKVNPPADDLDNPWDKSVIWLRPYQDGTLYTIYCFVPHPSGF